MPSWFKERFTEGHLDINKMLKNGYTRLEAVEIQNQMKDILDSDPIFSEIDKAGKATELVKNKDTIILQALEKAIKRVKVDKLFESGFKPEPLKYNEFYVIFDLDETLLDQWYKTGQKGKPYYDFKVPVIDNIIKPLLTSPDYVILTPGFEKALKDINNISGCKGIIFFSAKLDQATYAITDKIMIDGKPIKKFLKGILTRNYLVRESEPTKLAKDMRIIDESLKHVILIDDNPTRILENQKKYLREFPKFNPDEYLTAKNSTHDTKLVNYFEKLLPVVVNEIKEAEKYSLKNKVTFGEAFYPYSTDPSIELIMLEEQGYTRKEAIDFIRKNKNIFDVKFFFYEQKNN